MNTPVTRRRDGTYVGDLRRVRHLRGLRKHAAPILHAFGAQVLLHWCWEPVVMYCQRCHQKIEGEGKRFDGKLLCLDCWEKKP